MPSPLGSGSCSVFVLNASHTLCTPFPTLLSSSVWTDTQTWYTCTLITCVFVWCVYNYPDCLHTVTVTIQSGVCCRVIATFSAEVDVDTLVETIKKKRFFGMSNLLIICRFGDTGHTVVTNAMWNEKYVILSGSVVCVTKFTYVETQPVFTLNQLTIYLLVVLFGVPALWHPTLTRNNASIIVKEDVTKFGFASVLSVFIATTDACSA